MGSLQFTSPSFRILSVLGLALCLSACGPQGLGNSQMNSFGANANSPGSNRENDLLNRLFRDSPAGQPPPAQNPPVPDEPLPKPQEPPSVPEEPQGPVTNNNPGGPVIQAVPAKVRGYWDERVADGRKWTGFAVQALNHFGGALLNEVPKDISNYCPRYAQLGRTERIDFWVKIISAIAAVESGYRPSSSYKEKMNDRNGNRVVSRGLLQISLESTNLYGCATNNDGDLHSPKRNIECGVKILNRLVPQDGVISRQGGARWYGAARYWSTLRPVKKSSKTIRALLKTNPHCH